ncbi:MAG: hypothetical protein LBF85_03515 [Tannerella sp.]|nr:hypothetical protein [Tannerella sp.]
MATGNFKTFGSIGKQFPILTKDGETLLMHHKGKGALTHIWFGGDFKGYETFIRIFCLQFFFLSVKIGKNR